MECCELPLCDFHGLYFCVVDRYRLLDPKQKYVGVANGTLDEIEAQLRSGLKSVVDSRENKIKIEWTSGD